MSTQVKPTPGVKLTPRFGCPVIALVVPVGTKPGVEVIAVNDYNGKTYGPYRVASVLKPGENATETYAMAYRIAKPEGSSKPTSQTNALLATVAQQQAAAQQQTAMLMALMAKSLGIELPNAATVTATEEPDQGEQE